jgi:hypothetical protein
VQDGAGLRLSPQVGDRGLGHLGDAPQEAHDGATAQPVCSARTRKSEILPKPRNHCLPPLDFRTGADN